MRLFSLQRLAFALLAIATLHGPALAQDYPNRPITLMVPLAPGGGMDFIARTIGQKLSERLGKPILVENRPGGGTVVATVALAKAPPDGYTLLMAANGFTINASLYQKIPYDPLKDFSPVTLFALIPNILVVHPSLPVRTVRDLIALTRAKPDELTHGSSGTGSPGHLAGEVFKQMTKVKFVHIAYKGSSQAVVDLLGGHLQLAFPTIPVVAQHVRSGRLRALGVTGSRRSASLPDVSTIDEAGVRGYEVVGWYGVLAPAGVPKDIVARLNAEIVKALRAPDLQERLLRDGAEPVGNAPEEFRAYIEADVGKWAGVINAAGIKFEP
jgi:tripartite-type tricarboxylate transporter receptor subunit TctC